MFQISPVWAQPVPPGTTDIVEDIRITRHNLSTTGLGDVKSATESEVCIFCHTPHGGSGVGAGFEAPLWNRNLPYRDTTGYILYDQTWSFSFEGTLENPTKPTGYSRLCLSCHDGVIALGSVINKPGSGGYMGQTPTTDSLGIGTLATQTSAIGGGLLTGDTRVLGTNLQNDHPISFRFDSTLATAVDTELVDPGPPPANTNEVTPLAPAGAYKTGVKRYAGDPSDPTTINKIQCTSCHNPHAITYPKFLRAPRLQDASESGFLPGGGGGPSPSTGQIICLYCHSKPGWDGSTHDVAQAIRAAYPDIGNYPSGHTKSYDFDGIHTVGQVACRNCHDPHTAQGAKRLHREGVDAFGAGNAIENTCFLCHSPNTQNLAATFLPASDPTSGTNHRFCDGVNAAGFCGSSTGARIAPDIWTQFNKDQSACVGGSGPGSAMCLQLPTLAASHEPVFIFRSQEGVQLKSEGVVLTPINNEDTPGVTTTDERHVECVDCHNPHQVNSPNLASVAYNGGDPPNAQGGRFKGMKGVGIDVSGTRPIVVGRFPGIADTDIDGRSANRDPYVYEVCFRCHGNSYENLFRPYRYPDDVTTLAVPTAYTSYTSIPFSPRTDPTNGPTGDALSLRGFSNKWLELNPETDDLDRPAMISIDLARYGQLVPSHTQQTRSPAYHPVVRPGRNRSPQLCKQLAQAFGLTGCQTAGLVLPSTATALSALNNLTIQCTDCHNSDKLDAFSNSYAANKNAPILGLLGPLTESNRRTFLPAAPFGDVYPDLNSIPNYDYITGRPTETAIYPSGPIGPHGSTHRRILRANYDTDILVSGRCFEQGNPTAACSKGDGYSGTGGHQGGGSGVDNSHYQKFLLCFQCHDRAAFDPTVSTTYYGAASSDQDRSLTRFFGLNTSTGVDSWWEGNLHMYHLRWTGAMCHECHYNIHSNVEGLNTIYGDGTGGMLPPDGVDDGSGNADGVIGTHLINFAPTVEGTTGQKPIWFYDGTQFRCYLRCHNEVMDSCAYMAPSSGTPNARWCAGGRNPGTNG